jgi:hypothetical protein
MLIINHLKREDWQALGSAMLVPFLWMVIGSIVLKRQWTGQDGQKRQEAAHKEKSFL